jgi:SAM-dependent methyltransferase
LSKHAHIRRKAFDKLRDYLVCPITYSGLTPDFEYKTLKNENGYTFEIKNFIPILLDDNVESGFDYKEHYVTDAELFDYFEQRTGGTAHDERRVREYVLSKIPESAKSVLDVGCGRAWIAKELIRKKDFVCSLDISLRNPEKALELYPSANHAAVVADSLFLPFRDNSFDCIVSSEVIEHIEDPSKFIVELFRCVKPGGKLIITTPYKEVIKYSLCIHCHKPTPVNSHLYSFDEDKLKSLCAGKDLAIYEWFSFGNKALLHLRLHVILRYFPFWFWKLKDSITNFFINKRAHILAIYTKKNG